MTTTTHTGAARPTLAARYATFMSRRSSLMPMFAAILILLVLLVGAQFAFGNFITPRNLSALLLNNAYLLILAVGLTFVILTGGSGYVIGSMIGVLVYGIIKTIIAFMGAEQSWTRIIIGGLLLVFIVVQRFIVTRSDRRR